MNKKYKESSMFGDMLTSIMKDDKPRVKKRRLSDIKAEKEAKVDFCYSPCYSSF